MGSNLITIGITADTGSATSAISAFASSAGSEIETLKARFRQASTEINQAAARIVDAENKAAEAAGSGNAQFAAHIQSVANAERGAMDQMIASRDRLQSAMAKMTGVAAAEGEAVAHTVPSWIAASSAAMTLEGRLPIRAFERFVTQVLPLGGILQAAFPVVGALALVGVLTKMAEKAWNAAQNFLFLKDAEKEVVKIGEQLAGQAESDMEKIGQLTVEALRESGHYVAAARQEIENESSKPIHLPKLDDKTLGELNTTQFSDQYKKLKDAYSEVIPSDLPGRIYQVKQSIADLNGEITRNKQSGFDPIGLSTHYASQEKVAVEAYESLLQRLEIAQQKYAAEQQKGQADLTHAATEEQKKQQEAARKASEAAHEKAAASEAAMQSQIASLEAETRVVTAAAEARTAAEGRASAAKTQAIENPYQRAIAVAQDEVNAAQRKADAIGAIDALTYQKEISLLEKRRAIAAADPKGHENVSHIDTEMAEKKAEYAERQIRAQEQLANARAKLGQVEAEEQRRMGDELAKGAAETDEKILKSLQDRAKSELEINKMTEDGQQRHGAEMVKLDDVYMQERIALGEARGGDLLKLKQRQADAEYEQTLKAIEKEREALKQAYSADSPEYKKGSAELDNKQQSAVDTRDLAKAADELKQIEQAAQKVKQVMDPLGRSFDQAMVGWIFDGKKFGAEMDKMARSVLSSWASMLIQMGVQWAERHAIMFALHEAFQLGITSTDLSQAATRAATTKVTDAVNATDQITSAAGVAAANAFASTSAIPIVGPEMAPAAAAAAFSEVMAFNVVSAERGAVLGGGNSLAFLHPHEMVLPSHLSRGIQNFFGGGSSTSNSKSSNVSVNGGIHYNAKSSMGGREFQAAAKGAIRNLNL